MTTKVQHCCIAMIFMFGILTVILAIFEKDT